MSRDIQACSGHLNPWNYKATPTRKFAIATIIAVAAIVAVAGVLAILASSGVPLHTFSSLGALTVGGGSALVFVSLAIIAVSSAWLISTPQNQSLSTPQQLSSEPPPCQDQSHSSSIHQQIDPCEEQQQEDDLCYGPLAVLKERRAALFTPLSNEVEEPPETFSLLDALQKRISEPKPNFVDNAHAGQKKRQFKQQRDAFAEKIREYVDGLIQGHVEIRQAMQTLEPLEGELTHPAQIDLILNFAFEQLQTFNGHLEDVEPIDVTAFMKEYIPLQCAAEAWKQLLAIERAPVLGEQELRRLEQIEKHEVLQTQLQNVALRIAAKHTTDTGRAQKVIATLAKHVNKALPEPPSLINSFVEKLTCDIQSLFQYKSESDPIPPLEIEHIHLIQEYIREQEQLFFNTYGIKIDDVSSAFKDLEQMYELWVIVKKLQDHSLVITAKTELLINLVSLLPQKTDPIWNKYHVIKDRMGLKLTHLGTSYFSNYQFTYPLSEEDEILFAQIETAFTQLIQCFGGKAPPRPEVDMDTANDVLLGREVLLEEWARHAQNIREVFDSYGNKAAVDQLRLLIVNLPTEIQANYEQGILEALYALGYELTFPQ